MNCSSQSYPPHEKLKSRKAIEGLFQGGKSVGKYPLRINYRMVDQAEHPFQITVSVSKRYFKRAHDRNYYKRVLREIYRLNKSEFQAVCNQPVQVMFLYQTKDRYSFEQLQNLTMQLLAKWKEQLNKSAE